MKLRQWYGGAALLHHFRRFLGRTAAPLLAAFVLAASSTTLAAAPVPKDVSYLLGMYYGSGAAFLIRENRGALELIYHFSDTDRDFSGGNTFPLTKVHFDSYTLTEEGPLLGTEASVKFDRDANGYGVLCRIGGKSFNRLFFPGQKGRVFRVNPPADADALRTAAEQAAEPARLQQGTASSLVNLKQAVPSLRLDLRYATNQNIFGRPLHNNSSKAYAAPAVADALEKAAARLAPLGYGLVVYEAYRPWYLSKYAYDLLPADKKGMLPNPKNGEDRNTGLTVDVGLYQLQSGETAPMISDFDEVSLRQYPTYPGGTTEERRMRDLLADTMRSVGFHQGEQEWWHFVLGDLSGAAHLNIPYSKLP
jgi:D-alanyl-D-alanine dipeptidase